MVWKADKELPARLRQRKHPPSSGGAGRARLAGRRTRAAVSRSGLSSPPRRHSRVSSRGRWGRIELGDSPDGIGAVCVSL